MRDVPSQRRSDLLNVSNHQVLRCHKLQDHNLHIIPDLKEQVYEGVKWIQVAQDITQWRRNLWTQWWYFGFSKKRWNSWPAQFSFVTVSAVRSPNARRPVPAGLYRGTYSYIRRHVLCIQCVNCETLVGSTCNVHIFRLAPHFKKDFCSAGMLHSVGW
jgi:hypothetical protein